MDDLDLTYTAQSGDKYHVIFWGHRSNETQDAVLVFNKVAARNNEDYEFRSFEHVGIIISDENRIKLIKYLQDMDND